MLFVISVGGVVPVGGDGDVVGFCLCLLFVGVVVIIGGVGVVAVSVIVALLLLMLLTDGVVVDGAVSVCLLPASYRPRPSRRARAAPMLANVYTCRLFVRPFATFTRPSVAVATSDSAILVAGLWLGFSRGWK